jgi:hypothetical protein
MDGSAIVRVIFIDLEDRSEIGRTELPAGQLPDDLESGQAVFIGDVAWEIVAAQPPSVAQAIASGQLTLELRRPPQVLAPEGILFSLPTFADPHPRTDGTAPSYGRLELHEDDWRQIEFVSRARVDLVHAELTQIRRIYTDYAHRGDSGRIIGFSSVHVRTQPTSPLGSEISAAAIRAVLPAGGQPYPGFGFQDMPGLVVDGFATAYGPVDLYGTEHVLALRAMPGSGTAIGHAFANVMARFDFVLVDWCRAQIIEPDDLAR